MSLATRIESLVIRVAQEFNDVRATAGNLASLSTIDKSSLVAAINELKAAVLSATAIDDNQIATSTTYSSNKIVALLDALKAGAKGYVLKPFDGNKVSEAIQKACKRVVLKDKLPTDTPTAEPAEGDTKPA